MKPSQQLIARAEEITRMLTIYCNLHLTDEYGELCAKLVKKVLRSKSADILTSGRVQSIAAGILQVISTNNSLSKSRTHQLTSAIIAESFAVSPATVSAKATLIRNAAKVKSEYDPDYATDEALDNNPALKFKVLFTPFIQSLKRRGALPKK